jgi:hypothetical protein
MSIASRIRLGLPLFDGQPYDCVCGEQNGKAGVDKLHALSCIKMRRTEVNRRHDLVGQKLHSAAYRVGCIVRRENQDWDSQKRGDFEVIFPTGAKEVYDVSIVQPTAPTALLVQYQGPHTTQLFAADQRAKHKHERYDAMAKQQGAVFRPFVLEVFGGWHPEATAVAKRITAFANRAQSLWSGSEAYHELINAAAVAVQIGNTRCFEKLHTMNIQAGHAVRLPPPSPVPSQQAIAANASVPAIQLPESAAPSRTSTAPRISVVAEVVQQHPARIRVIAPGSGRQSGFAGPDHVDDVGSEPVLPEDPPSPQHHLDLPAAEFDQAVREHDIDTFANIQLEAAELDDLFGDDAFGGVFDDPAAVFPTPRRGRQTARRVAAVAGVRGRGRHRRARAGVVVGDSNDE